MARASGGAVGWKKKTQQAYRLLGSFLAELRRQSELYLIFNSTSDGFPSKDVPVIEGYARQCFHAGYFNPRERIWWVARLGKISTARQLLVCPVWQGSPREGIGSVEESARWPVGKGGILANFNQARVE